MIFSSESRRSGSDKDLWLVFGSLSHSLRLRCTFHIIWWKGTAASEDPTNSFHIEYVGSKRHKICEASFKDFLKARAMNDDMDWNNDNSGDNCGFLEDEGGDGESADFLQVVARVIRPCDL